MQHNVVILRLCPCVRVWPRACHIVAALCTVRVELYDTVQHSIRPLSVSTTNDATGCRTMRRVR